MHYLSLSINKKVGPLQCAFRFLQPRNKIFHVWQMIERGRKLIEDYISQLLDGWDDEFNETDYTLDFDCDAKIDHTNEVSDY